MLQSRYFSATKHAILSVGLLFLVAGAVAEPTLSHASPAADSLELRTVIDDLRSDLPAPAKTLLERLRSNPISAQLAGPLGGLDRRVMDIQLSPHGDFLALVDDHGAVSAMAIKPRIGALTVVHPAMPDDELKAHNEKWNDANAFIMHGASPPITNYDDDIVSGHQRALLMGLDSQGRETFVAPPMRWRFVPGASTDATTDCTVLVYRKNFTGNGLFINGSDIESVCRASGVFSFALVSSGAIGDVELSPDGRYIAYMSYEGLRIKTVAGQPGPEKADKSQFGRPVWLDSDVVLSFTIGHPARIFRISTKETVDLPVRLSADRTAMLGLHISQFEVDNGGRITLIGPADDKYVWDGHGGGVAVPALER